MPLLILTRQDVEALVTLPDCITAVEQAFAAHANGQTLPTALAHVDATGGEFHIKAGGVAKYFALKANGGFFGNRLKHGLPNIQGIIYLADATNGAPLAVLDSIAITIMRTGAASAVAAKYLARADASSILICGSGTQARIQLQAISAVRPLQRAYVWSRTHARAQALVASVASSISAPVIATESLDVATECDIIVTSTTARAPLLFAEQVRPGTFIAAVGADSLGKHELDPRLFAHATVVTDVTEQCFHVGELQHAPLTRVHAQLGEIVAGKKPGRTRAEEITIFDSTGTALQDAAAAALVYERALAQKRGKMLSLA